MTKCLRCNDVGTIGAGMDSAGFSSIRIPCPICKKQPTLMTTSKHSVEHAPSCPCNIDWDAASLCDKEPDCTCGMGKHTAGQYHVHPGIMGHEIHTSYKVDGQTEHFQVGYTVAHEGISMETSAANADLFASAPETAVELTRVKREKAELVRTGLKVKVLLEEGDDYTQKQQWNSVFGEFYAAIAKADGKE